MRDMVAIQALLQSIQNGNTELLLNLNFEEIALMNTPRYMYSKIKPLKQTFMFLECGLVVFFKNKIPSHFIGVEGGGKSV